MIKTAFINFFANYKRLLFISLVIGIAIIVFSGILFFGMLLPIRNTDAAVYAELTDYLSTYLTSPGLAEVSSGDYLKAFTAGLSAIIDHLNGTLKTVVLVAFLIGLLILIAAPKLASFLALRTMRKSVTTKHTKTGILIIIMRQIISIVFLAIYTFIAYIWIYAVFLLPLVSQAVNAVKSLFTAWYIHYREFPKRSIINFKNTASLAGSNILLTYFCVIIIVLIALINVITAIIIALPLLSYNACVRDITAAGYLKSLLEKGDLKLKNKTVKPASAQNK